jgi:hypothetical protein
MRNKTPDQSAMSGQPDSPQEQVQGQASAMVEIAYRPHRFPPIIERAVERTAEGHLFPPVQVEYWL